MGFFKTFFSSILRPTPPDPTPRPIDLNASPEDALKDAALGAAEMLAASAIQIYLKSAIARIPDQEKQLDVIEVLITFLEDYQDLLIESLAVEARNAAEATIGRD